MPTSIKTIIKGHLTREPTNADKTHLEKPLINMFIPKAVGYKYTECGLFSKNTTNDITRCECEDCLHVVRVCLGENYEMLLSQ